MRIAPILRLPCSSSTKFYPEGVEQSARGTPASGKRGDIMGASKTDGNGEGLDERESVEMSSIFLFERLRILSRG